MNYEYETLTDGVYVCRSASHTFGTDAFLLTGFAHYHARDRVCDLGTGCGIIPLLMQRGVPPKEIIAVDLQQAAIKQLELALARSTRPLSITPICADLRDLWENAPHNTLDLVTCNPPYNANGTGILSAESAHQLARHEISCTLEDICHAASYLLKYHGRLCMCCRPERLADMICAMRVNQIEPKRLRLVCQTPQSRPWLFLLEGQKNAKPFLQIEPTLFLRDGSDMTSEAAQLCHFGEGY